MLQVSESSEWITVQKERHTRKGPVIDGTFVAEVGRRGDGQQTVVRGGRRRFELRIGDMDD